MTATEQLQDRYAAVHHADLRHAAGRAGPRQRLRGLGRGRQRLPRPDRRHRGQRARARPSGLRRGGGRAGRAAGAHLEPVPARAAGRLAERLLGLLGVDGRVFFCNSGAEANEAALKLVRRRQGEQRPVIVAAEDSFHGRTMGALALTGKSSIRDRSGPSGSTSGSCLTATPPRCGGGRPGLRGRVPRAVPGRGRRRARPAGLPARGARGLRRGRGAAGAGRDPERHRPDRRVVRLPARGHRARRADAGQGPRRRPADRRLHRPGQLRSTLGKGDHGSTFGGNPIACAAALAVLDTIERDGLLGNVTEVGASWLPGSRRSAIRW